MKFRKKPVVIEAMQFTDALKFEELAAFMRGATFNIYERSVKIHTLEGIMEASPGDWIIRGVKGEFYPCKPDIFTATYEPVE